MNTRGEIVRYKASDALARQNGTKEDRRAKSLANNAKLQRFLRVKYLANIVPLRETELDAVKGEATRLDAEITRLRNAAMASGKPNPTITRKLAELDELPAMIAAAEGRLEAAQRAYTIAKEAMDADERADAAEIEVEAEMRRAAVEKVSKIEAARAAARQANIPEPEAVEDAPRGRGRPPKVV